MEAMRTRPVGALPTQARNRSFTAADGLVRRRTTHPAGQCDIILTETPRNGETKERTMARMLRNALVAAVAASAVTAAATASAAEIDWFEDESGTVITIDGEITAGDEIDFAKTIRGLDDALVVFNSPGGDLAPGLEIGLAIRDSGFDTLVPDGYECASACALAWLGGDNRAMGGDSYVGFHAAYVEVGHQAQETGAGNAVIGAYLHELGLSYDTIFFLTSSPPDSMYWLTFDDAADLGIEVERFQVADAPDFDPAPHQTSKG